MPSPRPRVGSRGTYMPSAYTEHKEYVKLLCRAFKHYGTQSLIVELIFTFKRPKRLSKNKYSMPVGDLDNLEKTYLDALEGIVYEDDRQIVEKHSKKQYGDEDSVEITLKPVV